MILCDRVGPVAVGSFSDLFGCPPAGRASGLVGVSTWGLSMGCLGLGALSMVRPAGFRLLAFCCSGVSMLASLLGACLVSSRC